MMTMQNKLENKIEKCAAQLRIVGSDLRQTNKFVAKKNDDTTRMQEIINNFKDRLMEKFAVLSDEYTEQFKKLEHKQLQTGESVSKVLRLNESYGQEMQSLKIEQVKDIKQLEFVKEEVKELKGCFKYGPRITTLEN